MKAAAEAIEKDQEELQQNAHKRKSSKRHYLEPLMKTVIKKYAVIYMVTSKRSSRLCCV